MPLKRLLITAAALLLAFASGAKPLERIVIDPGHGGMDKGAVYNSLQEKEITLQISKRLQKKLVDQGWIVFLTRDSDRHLSLAERAQAAREFNGDLFLSVHINSSEDKRAQGMEIYFQNQLPPDEESMFQAKRENDDINPREELEWPLHPIAEASHLRGDLLNIIQDLQRSHRIHSSSLLAVQLTEAWQGKRKSAENTIRQAPFYVVSNVNMPSALVEVGFLSNQREAHQLRSAHYQNQVVDGIAKGLKGFKEMVDKSISPGLK
ncbi:MAG: N-acetylmuramoyl-L-alanine amidase [Bdellovibrionaceae bacterium]|nr:N-acetylmuramoyl-L-alanine amidase [Bdellovibrionales bacterium]MCB9084425.1 N-acetylmuramoyl-L-alanine amidase [Pseudobdellovibrionaceae bacterium]